MNTLAVQAWPGPTPAPQDGLFAILIDTSATPGAPAAAPSPPARPSSQAMRQQPATVGTSSAAQPSFPAARQLPATVGTSSATLAGSAGAQRDAARRQIRLVAREALAAVLRVPVDAIAIVSSPGTPPRILLAGAQSRIGCTFSYEGHHALAAINLQGPIGADIMRIQDLPDWQTVARDYLGPAAAAALQSAADRPRAYTKAWTRREAALKYHAQQLSEWQGDLPGRSISLILPVAELTGHIQIGDDNA
jgi:4'-phosphopantetheinyl transferase